MRDNTNWNLAARIEESLAERFEADFSGWSEDKARQNAQPLRSGFGAFLRAKGFRLDRPAPDTRQPRLLRARQAGRTVIVRELYESRPR
jgi:hypothetical protein